MFLEEVSGGGQEDFIPLRAEVAGNLCPWPVYWDLNTGLLQENKHCIAPSLQIYNIFIKNDVKCINYYNY